MDDDEVIGRKSGDGDNSSSSSPRSLLLDRLLSVFGTVDTGNS